MLKLLGRLRRNNRGNIAVITAMLTVPLVGVAGGAVDIGRLQMVHARLVDSADAASVGAVSKSSDAMAKAANMSGDGTINAGSKQAKKIFDANMEAFADVTISSLTTTV